MFNPAAFRRLCVETIDSIEHPQSYDAQPPSGGCVLKRQVLEQVLADMLPAAFRRLCVETA